MQHIPQGARVVAAAQGTVRSGFQGTTGRRAIVELHEGQASLGYHSDHQPVLCRWVRVSVYTGEVRDGRAIAKRTVERFSGARLKRAREVFDGYLSRLEVSA